MRDGAKTLVKWLTNNVMPTYQEPVSSQAKLPYASFSYVESEMAVDSIISVSIWTRSTSYSSAYDYADKLDKLLGVGDDGIIIKGGDSYYNIRRGNPFVQNKTDEDDTIRAVLANLIIKKF